MSLKHAFVSAFADGADATKVRPSNWGSGETDYDTTPTHVFSGGSNGDLLVRNTGNVEGAAFRALIAGDLPSGLASVVVTGPTQARTYTLPDANATILTTAASTNQSPSFTSLTLSGVVALAATTGAALGVINQAGTRLLHTFTHSGEVLIDNLFVGLEAGNFAVGVAGNQNTGIGTRALKNITTGSWNTAVGREAGNNITSGAGNAAFGGDSLITLTTGTDNAAFGIDTLRDLTTNGLQNTALGARAMKLRTSGNDNVAVGAFANANAASTGAQNAVVGSTSLFAATSGARNSALGYATLIALTTASDNVAIGSGSGAAVVSGGANTLVGAGSGNGINSGTNNIVIGYNNGQNLTSATNSIFIGDQLSAVSATANAQMNIGGVLVGFTSVGATPGLTGTFLAGAVATPSVKIGATAGLYQTSASKIDMSLNGSKAFSWEAGYYTIWDQAAHVRFGTGPDIVIRRSANNTLTIDDDAAGPGNLIVTTSVASAAFKTTTALITATNGGSIAAFTANMIGATSGPATAAQHGWQRMLDSAGNAAWVPVWK